MRKATSRNLVAGVLVFLPFAPFVSNHLSHGPSSVVRYGTEVLIDALAVGVAIRRRRRVVTVLRPLIVPFAVLFGFWLLSALWNDVSWKVVAIGVRSEFRYLPIVAIVAIAAAPLRDARVYLWVIVVSAAFQSVLALLYAANAISLQTTLGDRNQLGILLMLALILFASGFRELGLGTWAVAGIAMLLLAGVLATASREAAIGLGIGLAVLGFLELKGWPRLTLVAVAVAAAVVIVIPTVTGSGSGYLDSRSVAGRWQELFAASFSPDTNFRTRLLVENSKLVAHHNPVLGFGPGMGSAPSVIKDLSSPVYRSFRAYKLVIQIEPFVYDSNWAILVLETGFVGVALLGALFVYLAAIGMKAARRKVWLGSALIATLFSVVVAGFAAPIFREPVASFVLWLAVGLVLNCMRDGSRCLPVIVVGVVGGSEQKQLSSR
ncbi:MAG TPA: O-antigen ligase family protein [Galbitalea sp.]